MDNSWKTFQAEFHEGHHLNVMNENLNACEECIVSTAL